MRLQLQAAREEVVHLRKELSAQQEKLLQIHKLLEAEKAQLSVENEAFQQHTVIIFTATSVSAVPFLRVQSQAFGSVIQPSLTCSQQCQNRAE